MPDYSRVEDCFCGHSECLGSKYYAPDPFLMEIHGDFTPVYQCDGSRYESAEDI